MQVRPESLADQLARALPPAILIHGEETLLVLEAADAVREAARSKGIADREVFHAEKGFDYSELLGSGQSLSLFASQKLLDIRLPSGKPGKEGSAVIAELASAKNDDNILLITTGKLDRNAQKAAWFKAIDEVGIHVPCWPIRVADLPRWLEQRMRAHGLIPEPGVTALLAARVEGNLLAARQEIEKLALLHGPGKITRDIVEAHVADSSRFQVFLLLDTMLAGALARCLKILDALRAEGSAPAMIAALITREVRATAQLRQTMDAGGNVQGQYRAMGIWDSRKMGFERAMRRLSGSTLVELLEECGRLDRAIKGLAADEPWCLIERIVGRVCAGK